MNPSLTIVLLGNSGVGKGASGNTILGENVFDSRKSFNSVTTEINEKTKYLSGKQITVVDTPGILPIGSEKIKKEKIKTYSQQLLQSSRPCLFLVVVKIDRFTDEQKNAVDAAIEVIGDKGLKNSYMLFTGGEDLEGMTIDYFIKEDREGQLQTSAERFEGRYHVFSNVKEDHKQVEELLEKWNQLQTSEQGSCSQDTNSRRSGRKERRIVLLGLPGAGKSSSGNTILGSKKFKTDCAFNSVTIKCHAESEYVHGQQVTVVDTPGFSTEVLSDKSLCDEYLKISEKASPGPHAFVFVVKLGRLSKQDCNLLKYLQKVFSDDAFKYSMVLFTHGDELAGASLDDLINSNKYVLDLISMCSKRYCVFDNLKLESREQVRNFLGKIDEMVTANSEQCCTYDVTKRFSNKDFLHSIAYMVSWSKQWEQEQKNMKSLSKLETHYRQGSIEERKVVVHQRNFSKLQQLGGNFFR